MELFDKTIIEQRNVEKIKLFNSLESGMYINNDFIEFEKRDFFDSQVSVVVPKSFEIMSSEIAKIKYPREQRPQVIICNEKTDVSFALSYFNTYITNDDIPETLNGFLSSICKVNPAVIVYEKCIESLKKAELGWFDIKSYALDGQVYNVTFVTSVAGKCLLGWFNCPFELSYEWKPVIRKIMLSITDQTKLGGI